MSSKTSPAGRQSGNPFAPHQIVRATAPLPDPAAARASLIAQKLYRTVCGAAIVAVDNRPSCRPFQFFDLSGVSLEWLVRLQPRRNWGGTVGDELTTEAQFVLSLMNLATFWRKMTFFDVRRPVGGQKNTAGGGRR